MPTAEDIQDLKAERANILGEVSNHCPFGCDKGELDEYGYCQHLVGFTNDKKTMETLQLWKRQNQKTGEWAETGDKFVSGQRKHVKPVLETDTIVNPTREMIDKGVKTMVQAWVSSRVYRKALPLASNDAPSPQVKEKPRVLCDQCGADFKNGNGLRLHKKAKHSVTAPVEQLETSEAI
jgi:hypothetical protein